MPKLNLGEVFRLSPNAYMVIDRELRYVAANDAYLRETASTLEALLGKRVFDLFPNDPNDPNNTSLMMLRTSFERVLRSKKVDVLALIPYRVPRAEGDAVLEDRFWSATHTPLLDEAGEVAYILQHTVDVTDLERLKRLATVDSSLLEVGVLQRAKQLQDANRALEDERRNLLHLFDQAPSIMGFLRGEEHVFEITNHAYLQLVGFRDMIGKPVAVALPEVVEQGFVNLLDEVYRTGEPFVGRGVRVALQRSVDAPMEDRYLDFIYQPIRGIDGRVIGIFVQGHDISEQMRAQAALHESERELRRLNEELEVRVAARTAELEEANRELESFSYSVSHDLRAPLRHITGFAQLLERRARASLDAESLEHLHTISKAAKEGGKLVDDLLAFSRLGRAELNRTDVSLRGLVEDTRRELAGEIGGRTIAWQIGELPHVQGDPALLRLVFKNLLGNAVKYTSPRAAAHIEVGAREQGDELHVWVRDDGVGFDMQYVDKLFGVFQRLHSAEQFEGTGIGLANVRRIVNRHGGRVWAEGKVDQGATFHLTLPRSVPSV